MSRVEVEAIVATDQPLAAYGGVRVSENVLHQLADAIRSGSIPMLIGHDIRRPLNSTILDVEVRQRSDGYNEVWMKFTVDAEGWAEFENERVASGGPGGFSFSASERITVVPALNPGSEISFELEADASHWSDDELLAAADDLRAIGSVTVGRRYQFALEPLSIVVLALIVKQLIPGVISNAIYDALKRFLRRGHRTTFQFYVEREGDTVQGRLETDDPEALRRAIDAFDRLVNPGQWTNGMKRNRIGSLPKREVTLRFHHLRRHRRFRLRNPQKNHPRFQAIHPPRPLMISAESAESRPSRYAVASRAWTRQPRPRAGSYEEDGGGAGRRQPRAPKSGQDHRAI